MSKQGGRCCYSSIFVAASIWMILVKNEAATAIPQHDALSSGYYSDVSSYRLSPRHDVNDYERIDPLLSLSSLSTSASCFSQRRQNNNNNNNQRRTLSLARIIESDNLLYEDQDEIDFLNLLSGQQQQHLLQSDSSFDCGRGRSSADLQLTTLLDVEQQRQQQQQLEVHPFVGLQSSSSSSSSNNYNDKDSNGDIILPRFLKTGTTIAGLVIDTISNGNSNHNNNSNNNNNTAPPCCVVILGADTRATSDRMVADKQSQKIHPLAYNVFACGAGTSADLDHTCRQAQYSFWLQDKTLYNRMAIGNQATITATTTTSPTPPVVVVSVTRACRWLQDFLYDQGGSCQANLIVGGVDFITKNNHQMLPRATLRAIHPHGSVDCVAYTALGSGMLAALSVLESRYSSKNHPMTEEEGIQVVTDAILAGIHNDLGSGSQVDLCIIRAVRKRNKTKRTEDDNDNNVMIDGDDDDDGEEEEVEYDIVVEYRRAAVPEEVLAKDIDLGRSNNITYGNNNRNTTLQQQQQEEEEGQLQHRRRPLFTSIPGANGFGNVPFAIRSRRVLRRSSFYEHQQQQQQHSNGSSGSSSSSLEEKKWQDILGLLR